jgi:amino acid adenylation domain-containing protein
MTVVHRFQEQARRSPDAVAVVAGGEELPYAELNRRANRLAHWLRGAGVGPDVPVGICLERSLELAVGVLGAVKAGGAYLPLDPSDPPLRLAGLLEASRPPVVLTQRRLLPALAGAPARRLCLDDGWDEVAGRPAHDPPGGPPPGGLVSVIHTSGSTGRPKGVMNTHEGLDNRLRWMQRAYGLTPADRVVQKTPVTFDVSGWELFWPLLHGARMVMARPDGHRDADHLVELVREQGVTVVHFVPAMLSVFLEAREVRACRSLRLVVCSGEALSPELQARCLARLPGAELHNLYGPTEASIDVTAWACTAAPGQTTVPIGTPIDGMRVDVLDRGLRPVPDGEPGELHLSGVGLARGYLGRPDLTAERFVPDPLAGRPGERAYRTGDLGRRRPDGVLEYLGRLDHQVKLRGFRIELDELQVTLERHPGVRDCVVLLQDGRLVACFVAAGGAEPAAGELRAFLRERLPEHMVPSAFVPLGAFPVTPSGKVDRRALAAAAPGARAPSSAAADRAGDAMRRLLRERGR